MIIIKWPAITKLSHDSILETYGVLRLWDRPLHSHPTQAISGLHHFMERQTSLWAGPGPLLRRAVRPELGRERLRPRHVVWVSAAAAAAEIGLRAGALRRSNGPACESWGALGRGEMAFIGPPFVVREIPAVGKWDSGQRGRDCLSGKRHPRGGPTWSRFGPAARIHFHDFGAVFEWIDGSSSSIEWCREPSAGYWSWILLTSFIFILVLILHF